MKSIQTRLNILVLALIAAIFFLVFLYTRDLQKDTLDETRRVTERIIQSSLREEWYKKIRSLASIYAYQLVRPVYVRDLETIRSLSLVAVRQDLVAGIFVLASNGMILSDGTEESLLLGQTYDDHLLKTGDYTIVRMPIQVGSQNLGEVLMAFDDSETDDAISSLFSQVTTLFYARLADSEKRLVIMLLASLGMGVLGSWLIARGLSRPLGILSTAIEKIGRYEYDISVPEKGSDEIGRLGQTLKRVADSLRETTVSKTYLETILSSLPIGVAVTDGQGMILMANPNFRALCRAGDSAMEGRFFPEAAGVSGETFGEILESLREKIPVRERECGFRPARGKPVDALLSGLPLRESGAPETDQYLFLVYDITERKGLERKLEHIATHDHLTGLPNRRHILHRLESEMEAYRRDFSAPFWLIFVDLDRFKDVNDTYGHHVGDEILKETARRMAEVLREGDMVARLGGDEFLVLLGKNLEDAQAFSIANRLLDRVRRPFEIGNHSIVMTASVGLARSDPRHKELGDLMVEADTAMYEAKETGKNKVTTIFDMDDSGRRTRLLLEKDIRDAISQEQFVNHYQPIVDLPTGRVIGCEALARWNHPTRGLIPPGAFIPAAENSGLIQALGETVFRNACRRLAEWSKRPEWGGAYISVNVSIRQLYDRDFPDFIFRTLEETGADPAGMVLEFTESLIMRDPETAASAMKKLREKGLRLAIDDFGTGYSSLSYLHRFPFDILKVDRSFLSGIDVSLRQIDLLRIIRDIGRNLKMDLVLEGIERQEQVEVARNLGISGCQGFYFCRPQPPEALREKLFSAGGLGTQDWVETHRVQKAVPT
jgi:diguanylate cyclase (GGDEF)-like protein/PAS domain S-box-containing protein